ncbi:MULTISPECIES: hypothetical protein [Aureimonas]|jgi:hypothetical protein|uniref:Uncharacterized protein n=1 Tax=Aureimonas flava TaxID=2320271 RepID=A0A3A1WH46_9HYPH|nr:MULTISPECIES: hypothetical protein [Aureimonas]RIX99119.1 hypothetical protein D3218_15200 [Aureimonas flava]
MKDDAFAPVVVPESSGTTQRPRLSPEELTVVAKAMRESAARMDAVLGTDMMLALAHLEGRPEDPLAAFVEYCGLPDMPEAR